MCGIAGVFGHPAGAAVLTPMLASQRHRGPDAEGQWHASVAPVSLGHNRLSIIDLSDAGRQPMTSANSRLTLVFNGEIYNYLELRRELADYPYRTRTDSEVILAAYQQWGAACLDRFIGMFALLIWDAADRRLFAARDRFGVKPLYYHATSDRLLVASEIKALHAAGVEAEPDTTAWATYLTSGLHDHSQRTFWRGVQSLPAGSSLTWQDGHLSVTRWYDLAAHTGETFDDRGTADVEEEYASLLHDSVRLRFRADVPVGICLSGGLDSSTLLAAVQAVRGAESDVTAFTFTTGDDRYDELPWVRQMLSHTRHPLVECRLDVSEVPALAASVQASEDEPFGGVPTIAYARLFEEARRRGVIVLLDGQGMDEQWAGYDYYRSPATTMTAAPVQGTTTPPFRSECLTPEFRALAEPFEPPQLFTDRLRNLQLRDALFTKIPRALRFSDRVSMRSSNELREPFLDHRLFELALRQPADRKIQDGTGKWLLRRIVAGALPPSVVTAPKRPLQTPQREWLRGPLHGWATGLIEEGLRQCSGWLDADAVRASVERYRDEGGDSSIHIWQWLSIGALLGRSSMSSRSVPHGQLTLESAP
jgi:asparagine synthase (glutamine-hydrolysing)